MKRILLIGFSFYCLFSCKRKMEINAESMIYFKANGVEYSWKGTSLNDSTGAAVLHTKNLSFPEGDGYLLFWRDLTSNKFRELRIAITKDGFLTRSTYAFKDQRSYYTGLLRIGVWNSTRTNLDGADYVNGNYSDYISVTITDLSNGFVSGGFRATLTKYQLLEEKMVITDGVFKNLILTR